MNNMANEYFEKGTPFLDMPNNMLTKINSFS